jgi:hypothetical protein
MRLSTPRTVALFALLAGVLGSGYAGAMITIAHEPIECVPAVTFAVVEAGFEPVDQLSTARLFFRAKGTTDWYFAEFSAGTGSWSVILPQPEPTTQGIDYFVAATDREPREYRSGEYHPVVTKSGTCERRAAGALPAGSAASLRIGLTRDGQAAQPPGFLAAGIASIQLVSGAVVAFDAASAAGGVRRRRRHRPGGRGRRCRREGQLDAALRPRRRRGGRTGGGGCRGWRRRERDPADRDAGADAPAHGDGAGHARAHRDARADPHADGDGAPADGNADDHAAPADGGPDGHEAACCDGEPDRGTPYADGDEDADTAPTDRDGHTDRHGDPDGDTHRDADAYSYADPASDAVRTVLHPNELDRHLHPEPKPPAPRVGERLPLLIDGELRSVASRGLPQHVARQPDMPGTDQHVRGGLLAFRPMPEL